MPVRVSNSLELQELLAQLARVDVERTIRWRSRGEGLGEEVVVRLGRSREGRGIGGGPVAGRAL